MLNINQRIMLLRGIIHFIVFLAFTFMLREWALGLAVSVFTRCPINKLASKLYYSLHKLFKPSDLN